MSDLRSAAELIKGRKVNPRVRMLVVPGSEQIKKQAEAEGLPEIFRAAGADWREAGCSMCIAMNGDQLDPGQYCVSTSNRNFEGRQGKGGRTFLASPLTAVVFLGSTPIGGPIAGAVSEQLGPRAGIAMGALAALLAGVWTLRRLARTRTAEGEAAPTGPASEAPAVARPLTSPSPRSQPTAPEPGL